jgi:large subunit ribosomal protein L10
LAFTKKQKQMMVAQYEEWLEKSQAIFILSYTGLTNKQIERMRRALREAGGEGHILKNTLFEIALKNKGIGFEEELVETSLAGFAFHDPAAIAKILADTVKDREMVDKLDFKVGFLGGNLISAEDIRNLAKLPPLPIMRAQILGTILAPASKLVRTINEPGSQVARVLKAYSEA